MSDHEFEKKVQQKMDEFKLTPSTAVWTSVEKNIRRDKRRRRAIIWLPLLFLLLGGSGYFFFAGISSSKTNTPSVNATPSTPSVLDNDKTTNDQHLAEVKKISKPEITASSVKPKSSPERVTRSNHQTADQVKLSKQKQNLQDGFARIKHPSVAAAENNTLTQRETTNPVSPKANTPDSAVTSDNSSNIASSETISPDSAQQVTAKKDASDSASKKIEAVAGSTEKPGPQSKKVSKWKFGLSGNVGISRSVAGGFGNLFKKSNPADYVNAAPVTTSPPGAIYYRNPSPINPGFSFSVGAFAQRNISKRVNILFGLQYTYVSTTTSVGRRVDSPYLVGAGNLTSSLVSNYYPNINTQKYTNSYHFIEIPASIELKFNQTKKLPLAWESGFQLLQLVSTNALQYDGSHGVYYKDNSYFNKTQLGVFTGLSFETFRKSKHPLWIGPRIDYLASNLLKKNYANEQHLVTTSITAKMLLKK